MLSIDWLNEEAERILRAVAFPPFVPKEVVFNPKE
jgi:hypothetical protein